ncbi:MAG: hypothetical protein EA369_05180 [Bradymonadales bacterium]|nr:MAG: hypothetical protein EA369_05180 [Bradymonadales bacterium]
MGKILGSGIDQRLQALDRGLENLKSLYEQYFCGLIRREPIDEHRNWKRELNSISSTDLSSAPYKFRYKNLKARHLSYSRLWERTVLAIEEGRFVREHHRIKNRPKSTDQKPSSEDSQALAVDRDKLEKLYLNLKSKLGNDQKIPQKERFFDQVQLQIARFKEKNPNQKFQIKVAKDPAGKFQLKIQKKS